MSSHFTPAFKEAYEKVLKIAEAEGEQRGRLAFRDAMLELGHEERVMNLYRIQDKLTKKAAFFKPNAAQARYLNDKALRNIVLKCRQVGFTTLNCVRGLDYALWEANTRTGILCHKLQLVKTIFNDITKFSFNHFLKDWGHLYKPTQKQDSSTSLSFKDDGLGRPLESSILVLHDFRGKTLHFLHVAEASRVEEERLIGSINGVPDNGETTLESTAHGRGGSFYQLWQSYRAKKQHAPYKGFFVPWFEQYPEEPENWQNTDGVVWTPREQELMAQYPGQITEAHLMWRRFCIEVKCNNDEEKFENEYPTNDVDCFLTGEASVFPSSVLRSQDKNTRDPWFVGFLLEDNNTFSLTESAKGMLAVWEKPETGKSYVIGADPAGGVGRDRGAAYVMERKSGKHVARLWGDMTPADFAQELYKLARFYHKAWICVEANNHGHVVIHELGRLGYANLYKRQAIDEVTKRPAKKVGFITTSQTKILITEKFKKAVQDHKTTVLDAELISEMSTFVQVSSKTGATVRREAASGAHDDLVMAACLAQEMHDSRPLSTFTERPLAQQRSQMRVDPETGFYIGELVNE